MKPKHVAFFVAQGYGHILPTLGIASELVRRGHDVSYAVTSAFSPLIHRVGARAITFVPLKSTRARTAELMTRPAELSHEEAIEEHERMRRAETAFALAQLEQSYSTALPNVIVYDGFLDLTGPILAMNWEAARVRFYPLPVNGKPGAPFIEDDPVIVPIPKFLNANIEQLDGRLNFVGFIPEGRRAIPQKWHPLNGAARSILIAPTTGLLAQNEFCRLAISAFCGLDYTVVLSVPSEFDPLCTIDSATLPPLTGNIRLNRYGNHLDILEHSSLFVGQGGPGSTLEALYSGVPALLAPATPAHDITATRVAELGLGLRLSMSTMSAKSLRESAIALMEDKATLARVRAAQASMHADCGGKVAADLIEAQLRH